MAFPGTGNSVDLDDNAAGGGGGGGFHAISMPSAMPKSMYSLGFGIHCFSILYFSKGSSDWRWNSYAIICVFLSFFLTIFLYFVFCRGFILIEGGVRMRCF